MTLPHRHLHFGSLLFSWWLVLACSHWHLTAAAASPTVSTLPRPSSALDAISDPQPDHDSGAAGAPAAETVHSARLNEETVNTSNRSPSAVAVSPVLPASRQNSKFTLEHITTHGFIEVPLRLDTFYYAQVSLASSSSSESASDKFSLIVDTTYSQLAVFDSSVPHCKPITSSSSSSSSSSSPDNSGCVPGDNPTFDLSSAGTTTKKQLVKHTPAGESIDIANIIGLAEPTDSFDPALSLDADSSSSPSNNQKTSTSVSLYTDYDHFNTSLLDHRWLAGQYLVDDMSLSLNYYASSQNASVDSSSYTLTNISFALANHSSVRWPGVFGLAVAPRSSSSNSNPPPSLWNQLVSHGLASANMYSLSMYDNYTKASLLFDAVNVSRLASDLYVSPLVPVEFDRPAASDSDSDSESESDSMSRADYSSYYPYSFPATVLTQITIGVPKGISWINKTTVRYTQDTGHIPVVLDSGNALSYLPYNQVVSLATQTGAYYSSSLGLWIQDCSIRYSPYVVSFHFFNASVDVPISQLVLPLYNQSSLQPLLWESSVRSASGSNSSSSSSNPANKMSKSFSSGQPICALAMMDSDSMGYNALGASVLSSMYLSVDYANLLLGIGQITNPVEPPISPSTFKQNPKSSKSGTAKKRRHLAPRKDSSNHKSSSSSSSSTTMTPTTTYTVRTASTTTHSTLARPTLYAVRNNLTDLPMVRYATIDPTYTVTVANPAPASNNRFAPVNTLGNNLPLFALDDSQISYALWAASHYHGETPAATDSSFSVTNVTSGGPMMSSASPRILTSRHLRLNLFSHQPAILASLVASLCILLI